MRKCVFAFIFSVSFSAINAQINIPPATIVSENFNAIGIDGIIFTKLGEVNARNSSIATEYNYTDLQPFSGNNYYRLRIVDIDGTKKYSLIVKVRIGGSIQDLHIFPNPVTGLSVNVQMQNIAAGKYMVKLYNLHGQVVFTKLLNHAGGSATEIIYLPETTGRGLYQMEIGNSLLKRVFKLVIL